MEEATEHQQPVDSPADEDQLAQPHVDVEPNLILSYSASPKRLARRIQNITQSPSSEPAQPSQPSQSTGETETDVPDVNRPQNTNIELSARESLQSDPLSQTDVELQGEEDPKPKQPISLSEIVCKQSRDATFESSESTERKPTQLNPQSQLSDTEKGEESFSFGKGTCTPPIVKLNQPNPLIKTSSPQPGDASISNQGIPSSTHSDTKHGVRVATSQDKVASLNASSPPLIMNGLRLKLQGEHSPFAFFSYALFPLMDKYVPVDWKILVRDNFKVESVNIRCHELQSGDDLAMLVSIFEQAHAEAVILINTQENYSIAPHFLKGMERSSYPILILTKKDGGRLLKKLDQYGDVVHVLARVDAESEVHVQLARSPTASKRGAIGSTTERNGSRLNRRMVATSRSTFDLNMQLNNLMFDSDSKPVAICKDQGRFTMIMASLTHYEKQAKVDSSNHPDVSEAINKMRAHFDEMLIEDFPLYILIAYRMHLRTTLYMCDELKSFIPAILDKVEATNYKQLAYVFNSFLKRGDFHVMSGITKEEESKSVFWFLECACWELSDVSFTLLKRVVKSKLQQRRPLYSKFCYTRMMWIFLALRLHHEFSPFTNFRAAADIWHNRFIRHQSRIVMTDDTIKAIVDGLEFGRLLQLPQGLSFSWVRMTDLLVSGECIRPFRHLQNYIWAIERFLDSQDDVHVMLTHIRVIYIAKLKEPSFTLSSLSIGGTLADTITEGIGFLDTVSSLWDRHKFNAVDIEPDCISWLELFLGLIDITSDRPDVHLKKFLGHSEVLKKYRFTIVNQIMGITRSNFHRLSIQQFFSLYKAFHIWPNKFLEEYLKSYTVPPGMKISDGTCNQFFSEVVTMFPAAHEHHYLLDFLLKILKRYRADRCAGAFVLDLLQLGVPKLFADADGSNDGDVREAKEVQKDFIGMLRNFIHNNALKQTVLGQMTDILKVISEERDDLHLLIVSVLHDDIFPGFKVLDNVLDSHSSQNHKAVLEFSITYLCENLSLVQVPTAKQAFCWGLVSSCCSRVRVVPEHFEWLHNYSYVISELSKIFNAYCTGKKLSKEERIIVNGLPEDVTPFTYVKEYFEWVCTIQSMLEIWQDKFVHRTVNYDEILMYTACSTELEKLSYKICATSLVIDSSETQKAFLTEFELLNVYLLRYIPQHPDAKWCTFPALLNEYGVALPQTLFSPIQKYIVFPDKENTTGGELLVHPIPASTNGKFQPGLNIPLKLSQQFSLRDLSDLVQGLDHFQRPLIDQMDMLIFFKLNRSVMFDKYLRLQIRQVSEEEDTVKAQVSTMSAFQFRSHTPLVSSNGVSVEVLRKSSECTQALLKKIMIGEAAYSDITAEESISLETLDIEKELDTLKNYFTTNPHVETSFGTLANIRSLLELFQYNKHVENICNVCEQYQLCLEDPQLQELRKVVCNLKTPEERFRITPNEASTKLVCIKKLLCIKQQTPSSCLQIFEAVSNSVEFYQFVQDKQFHGEKGTAVFRQQYQLITAQLQQEEYDETVLNHLLAAFEVISPFMNLKQSFEELILKVTSLNTTIGLKQLETVNQNITLIRLWFSRAEGETIQNVAKELDNILETGHYTFKLHQDSEAQMFLEFTPSGEPSSAMEVRGEPESRGEPALGNNAKVEKWNAEQIGDFVRKLGFMDTQKEGGEKIKHFRRISEIVYKLLDLYRQLKDLGCSEYSKGSEEKLSCSMKRDEAKEKAVKTERTLESWRNHVAKLRRQNDWLLFFSIPKIICLYNLISSYESDPELTLDRIVHEISFLFKNDEPTRKDLRCNIQRELGNCLKEIKSDDPPIHIVEIFLALLFTNDKLPNCSDPSLPHPLSLTRSGLSLSHDFTHLLHYCPGFSQGQLIQTVIEIYSGIPEAFEVLHCCPTTPEGELTLFLKRSAKHHLHSLVLEVNKLPFKLQESLMQLDLPSVQQDVQDEDKTQNRPAMRLSPCIHFIETTPSVLRDIPWIQLREHKDQGVNFEKARTICTSRVAEFACIQLVLGAAGSGKTHYIKEQLSNSPAHLTIAVNEAFIPLNAISKLRTLPLNQRGVSIFFNFTMHPPGDSVDDSESKRYQHLIEVIGWFFFDLVILGYVEDRDTGRSFRIPGGLQWAIYIEVPSVDEKGDPGEALKQFSRNVPALRLICTEHYVNQEKPYTLDEDVQLVCKYLKALQTGRIDLLYTEPLPDPGQKPLIQQFSLDQPDLGPDDCHSILQEYMPAHIRSTKITQRLFVKYMKRRCQFLDTLPAFNYNTGFGEYTDDEQGKRISKVTKIGKKHLTITRKLGSTLMNAMLKEVGDFCDPDIKENWSVKPHQQLIYDCEGQDASFGLITLNPQALPEAVKADFMNIGVKIPSMADLCTRKQLDALLSRALNIKLEENRLPAIDDSTYVLTLDYTLKMLNIHERYECGVPVIIEGETGVGKTALIEMLSTLWNQSLLFQWKKQQDRVIELFRQNLGDMATESCNSYVACVSTVADISSGQHVTEDDLLLLCQLPYGTDGRLYSAVQQSLKPMRNNPVMAQLTIKDSKELSLEQLFPDVAKWEDTPEYTAKLLYTVLSAQLKPTFHKINIHAAMTPSNVQQHLEPVFGHALKLREAFERIKARSIESDSSSSDTKTVIFNYKMPFVTVFLDEINTSSCVGLFKEIIVDRTFDGVPIPENVFIVAACNPHRGNSMASLGVKGVDREKEKWVTGKYYVRKLHPTLQFLMWDYGSLDESQEKEYINAKLKMLEKKMPNPEVASLTDLIVGSQNKMRLFASEQIGKNMIGGSDSVTENSSHSCVSQRDIQRVFTLYQWFMKIYNKMKPHGQQSDYSRRAVLVALGIVYYMRLNNTYRTQYSKFLDQPEFKLPNEVTFTRAFEEELNWYIDSVDLPKGIARTQALKENIFATIVCTANHIPLIIVGAPGSSKTLSFNQTIANLKGAESRLKLFRDTTIFKSLDPQHYQCSRRTTSNEIQTVFSRAINRQRSHSQFKLPIYCVVFMDEAGLPEESHESLKVLHYHLDKQEVSFVAITNHVLDAAKTNRAVSLFRPEALSEDLDTLAKGCLCSNPEDPPPELRGDLARVVQFCAPYSALMESTTFARFFGLRDFIQFVNYLRRKRADNEDLTDQVVMHALERNFNGTEDFETICSKFLGSNLSKVQRRGILDILHESLEDRPQDKQVHSENEVRYKLIIDPSEDDSIVRLLFSFGILKRDSTRIFVCSNFLGDGQLQKINTIAAIRHSAIEGHTVVMSQTDDIHESFYDLFNQRFRRIDDLKEGPRYYTNIAIGAHLRPSRVHPNFQCVVVVKKSEVKNTPAPFLNRFEKYLISHHTLLETALERMPPSMGSIVRAAMEKVDEFMSLISGPHCLYGFCSDTLNSLVLTLLPSVDHIYKELGEVTLVDDSKDADKLQFLILEKIVQVLRECHGFIIPKFSRDEFCLDVESVFEVVLQQPTFLGLMHFLDYNAAAQAIQEATIVLRSRVKKDNVSLEGCLIIALLQQWLVRHLCKRLMQLMTSEALILHRNKIPFSYIKNYINFHTHFSLQNTIEKYYHLNSESKENANSRSATKVLCLTRSSPLIYQLPIEFPSPALEKSQIGTRSQVVLKDFVFAETDKLMVYKLSSILSQTTVQDLLKQFLESETAEVCLLVVNMQETSKEIVNHVRIMIEETEAHVIKKMKKLFVLLLHFPPAQFFHPCYPSLFLQGWDHCYLDTIAHSAIKGVVDIRDWFWQCCFPQQSSQLVEDEDALLQALQEMLPQAIPILASRVFFGSLQNGSFNSPMNGLQRSEVLGELLFKKGKKDATVGIVLCERFRIYWKPSVMAEELERAAVFSRNMESTLNITESIQNRFKNLFVNFLVYMISSINENFNIDIIFNPDCTPAIEELFLEIVIAYPAPELSQINQLSSHLPPPGPLAYTPRFPFFRTVYEIFENVLEESKQETNLEFDLLNDSKPQNLLTAIYSKAKSRAHDGLKGFPKQVVQLLSADSTSKIPDLWHHYFCEFVHYKLHLELKEDPESIAQQTLSNYFKEKSMYPLQGLQGAIELHCLVYVNQLDLAEMVSKLRPLNKLQKFCQLFQEPTSPSLPSSPPGSKDLFATFIIGSLFDTLVGIFQLAKTRSQSLQEKVTDWFRLYRDMMAKPDLKWFIFSYLEEGTPGASSNEAKLNLMQIFFLVVQTIGVPEDTCEIFDQRFISVNSVTSCPRLADAAQLAVEVMSSCCSENHDILDMRMITEGLFAHFFSPERQRYHPEDISWFLKLANEKFECTAYRVDDPETTPDIDIICSPETDSGLTSHVEKCSDSEADSDTPQVNINSGPEALSDTPSDVRKETTSTLLKKLRGTLSISVFKFYLGRILGQCNPPSDADAANSGSLLPDLYHQSTRSEIGNVLSASPDLGSPGPYIPKFYQDCQVLDFEASVENVCMQQPLAHLYFLTVLEHLMSKPYKLPILVKMASIISNLCASPCTCDRDRVYLWIEYQAHVQVIAKQLGVSLATGKFQDVSNILEDINSILTPDDSSYGGKGHGVMVVFHFFKQWDSIRMFQQRCAKLHEVIPQDLKCLLPFRTDFQQLPRDTKSYLFHFMKPEADGVQAGLYKQLCQAMKHIYELEEVEQTECLNILTKVAEECHHDPAETLSPDESEVSQSAKVDTSHLFPMMVWLVSYYEFFDKKISSPILCDIIGSPEMSPYLKEEGYIRIIQCFLNPGLMLKCNELEETDPLHDLFNPSKLEQQDESDVDLRHSLANMVAIVLSSPSQNNHLWYHMFAPQNLVGTYITGFMIDAKVSSEGLLYDCGVELTAEGEIGRQDYYKHAGRGTYTLHSLYLLLWSNFGAFCMALLTQPDADAKIHGPIISIHQPIRHYCLSKLRSMWKCMTSKLGLLQEERAFFIAQSMTNFQQLLQTSIRDSLQGVFETREELDSYETIWHCQVYEPTWNEIKGKCLEVWKECGLLETMRSLELHCPQFPLEVDFVQHLRNYGDLEQLSEGGELDALIKLVQGWRKLQVGGILLPDLVELYQWLHKHLAYIVTYEKAEELPLSKVIQLAAETYGEYITKLYKKVKDGYNQYIQLRSKTASATMHKNTYMDGIMDSTPLLQFLTVTQGEPNDGWLYSMIAEIIADHNSTLECFYSTAHGKQTTLSRPLPEQPTKLIPSEINYPWRSCITGESISQHGVSSLLQVIRSQFQPLADLDDGTQDASVPFLLKQLIKDIIKMFVAGKPKIDTPTSLRIPFIFKQNHLPNDMDDALYYAIEEIEKTLPAVFKKPLDVQFEKTLKCEFHMASHKKLFDIITALRTVCNHLVKELLGKEGESKFATFTLQKFMVTYIYEECTDRGEVLAKIGITSSSFKQSRLLSDLSLQFIFCCLQQFVKWLDQGVYDFCDIPLALKTDMTEKDAQFVEQELVTEWMSNPGGLVDEVKRLIGALKDLEVEGGFTTLVDGELQKPIAQCLKPESVQGDGTQSEVCASLKIPKTVLLRHYVNFRLALRRLVLKLEPELSVDNTKETKDDRWSEYTDAASILTEYLPHREEGRSSNLGDYVFDIAKDRFGFQVTDDESSNDFSYALMNGQEDSSRPNEVSSEESEVGQSIITEEHNFDLAKGHFDSQAESEDLYESNNDVSDGSYHAEIIKDNSPESTTQGEVSHQQRISHTFDLDQPSDEEDEPVGGQPQEASRSQDEGAKVDVISDHDRAKTYTSERVGEFLIGIGLEKYRKSFVDQDIDGDTLLDSLLGETKHEFLKELGVEFALDRVRIDVMFRRELRKTQPRFPIHVLVAFLNEKKLKQYSVHFEQNEIDGDMLLAMEPKLLEIVLNDIGIQSRVAKQKIVSKLKTFPQV